MLLVVGTASQPALAWGPVTFGSPVLAWGILACLIPVLVHLALRQRPRRQVFPAMRFLVQSQRSSTRAHRLKHLLLLLCRMMLILLLVGLLMKARCAPGGGDTALGALGGTAEPVSAVICLDDSASMGYRFQGRSRLRRAKDWAKNLLEDVARFPAGSQIAMVAGSSSPAQGAWIRSLTEARKRIDAVRVADHDRSVAMLLRKAYPLLSTARYARREIYLLSDLTEHGWRDSPPPVPRELTALYVLDVGQQENRNVALGWPQVPEHRLPAGRPATMTVRVRTGDEPADPLLEVLIDGEPRDRRSVGHLAASSEVEFALDLPPMTPGSHAVTVNLEPADALACDNRRFASVSVGELPRVLVVGGDGDRQVAALVAAMLAPSAQPESRHRFALERLPASRLTPADNLQRVLGVILADPDAVETGIWRALTGYLEAGGVLLIIPGPNTTLETYRQADLALPALIEAIEECPEPITLAAADLAHPFLKPFAEAAIDSINERRVFKRLALGPPAADARTIAPFSDRRAALVERRAGKGRVILFAFSPARDWSQFGTQAAPMIVLLHTILTAVSPPAGDIASFTAGQAAVRRIPDLGPEGVLLRDAPGAPPRPLPIEDGLVRLPTDRAGGYQLLTGEAEKPALLYCTVNVAEAESDSSRITSAAIEGIFPAHLLAVADDAATLARIQGRTRRGTHLVVFLGLALLALLFIESLFANRFYGFQCRSSAGT